MTTSAPAAKAAGSDGHPAPQGAEPILRLAAGFMAAKHLFAASELGLFEALAGSPTTIDALAARTGLTARAARISADAMVALGLLERDVGTYRNSDTAAIFLAGARLWRFCKYGFRHHPRRPPSLAAVLGQDQLPKLDWVR